MKVESHNSAEQPERASLADSASETPATEKPQAWELIDVGRYRPRRIRGSYLGRELG